MRTGISLLQSVKQLASGTQKTGKSTVSSILQRGYQNWYSMASIYFYNYPNVNYILIINEWPLSKQRTRAFAIKAQVPLLSKHKCLCYQAADRKINDHYTTACWCSKWQVMSQFLVQFWRYQAHTSTTLKPSLFAVDVIQSGSCN